MDKRVYYGEFNAEKYWRDENLAKLPEIPDNQAENIIRAMDELLFTLCDKEDTLITRYRIDPAQREYLKEIGFLFEGNDKNFSGDASKEEKNKSICQLLLEKYEDLDIRRFILKNSAADTFAVLSESDKVSEKYELEFEAPSIDVIKKVNSKIYSSDINKKLNIKYPLEIVNSAEEMYEIGRKYLRKAPIMLKDSFGVSGKGNLVISNENILQRIVDYIRTQEKSGKSVEFIIETFLEKEQDFSCQFFIDKSGNMEILSVQEVRNVGSSYNGSYTLNKEFIEYIRKKEYFSTLEEVAACLHEDGYYGDVCVDSMLLRNGELAPIVEINARKSMSLIKHNLDRYADQFKLNCCFTFLNTSCSSGVLYSRLMEEMAADRLLFKTGRVKGVIPLSSNALFINRDLDKNQELKKYKGRLYLAILYEQEKEKDEMVSKLIELLDRNDISVLK